MNKTSRILACTLALSALGGISQPALAEGNISIAQQFGIGYLILDVVRDQRLIEKRVRKRAGYKSRVAHHFRSNRDE
jgi:NitT/TauT family transport system substrate-binding protein